jgi:D-ribose pyranose/furanose isomerase RbsD
MNALAILMFVNCFSQIALEPQAGPADQDKSWKQAVDLTVDRLGHRNMIIVADSAYPIQTGSGVKVVVTGEGHEDVVARVIGALDRSTAVRALIALDKEFRYVPEKHAPGAAKLRRSILDHLDGKSAAPIRKEFHEKLLKEVGECATKYQVVVFKTNGTIPYSSVFFTLDCGYWSSEAEQELRRIMSEKDWSETPTGP